MERLNRVLAAGGIASRRKADQMILDGRVTVDGEVVREMGVQVDPERQRIRVDDRPLHWERRRYIMLHKPPGYITTADDERGRRTVMELVGVRERVVPVGRLDRQTSGLLLMTNDGDLLYRVTHPRFELEKEYEMLVDGHPPASVLQELRAGITIDGTRVVPSQVRPVRNEEAGTLLRITIHEGRNRIVRRMLERVGYPALSLTRIRVGPLHVRGLQQGGWRDLTSGELEQLREALQIGDEDRSPMRPDDRPSSGRDRRRQPEDPVRQGQEGRPRRAPGPRGGQSPQDGKRRGEQRSGGQSPGHRDRRPGGGRQEHRGQRRRPPN